VLAAAGQVWQHGLWMFAKHQHTKSEEITSKNKEFMVEKDIPRQVCN